MGAKSLFTSLGPCSTIPVIRKQSTTTATTTSSNSSSTAAASSSSSCESELVIDLMQWGLIPSWSDDSKQSYSMINARSETVSIRKAFKNLCNTKRCVGKA